MELSEQQKVALASWVREGLSLSDMQKRIESDFGTRMTYMDLRFLVDDLDLDLSAGEPEEPAPAEKDAADPTELVDETPAGNGTVAVSVDKLVRPGALVSGSVTFSDGETMGWQLDQMGQLGLLPGPTEGYRPSEMDIQAFQTELQAVLQQQGF